MNNIERYIQKAVKRELAAQSRVARRNDAARRHIDRRIYAVRHNDDIKAVFAKLKEKCQEGIEFFKRNSPRIAKLLVAALAAAGAVVTVKSVTDGRAAIARLEKYKSMIENEANNLSAAQTFESLDPEDLQMNQGNFDLRRKEIASTAMARNASAAKAVKFKMLLKAIAGLLGVLIGTAGSFLMKAKSEA